MSSTAKKRWLQAFFKELRSQYGMDRLSDRELARRARLHPQEVRRWLYADHLPSESSIYEFTGLLRTIGATPAQTQDVLEHIGLGKAWDADRAGWFEAAQTALDDGADIVFAMKSSRPGGHGSIARLVDPLRVRALLQDAEQRFGNPALSPDGTLLADVESNMKAHPTLHIWSWLGSRYVYADCFPRSDAARGAWSPWATGFCCDVGMDGEPHRRAIYHYDVRSHIADQLTCGNFADVWPAWHPDGSYVVFQRSDELWAVDPTTKATWCVLDRTQSGGNQVWAPAFAPDGTKLAFVHGVNLVTDEIRCLDLSTGKITVLASRLGMHFLDPCWSPDGKDLLFISNAGADGHLNLWLMDATGTGLQQITRLDAKIYRPAWRASSSSAKTINTMR